MEIQLLSLQVQVKSTPNESACMKRVMSGDEARVVGHDRNVRRCVVSAYPAGYKAWCVCNFWVSQGTDGILI